MFDPTQHLMKLKGRDYLQVAWRLVWFRDPDDGCPSYGIQTEIDTPLSIYVPRMVTILQED